ncbi:hypothetical protein [Tuwongella immobilis]|uniref:Uncharacterized protein n=1 Tax=Tuwongella immobilis TaxID=692036 RepID=A0A6C2YU63_9BACT|nr:hypothetical protein [Tuwongella immobilis]VIP04445.1 unnamed protein product [Tuwongella immobilis]VTS06252.1 unnamed protein product [Tuwongella immobilis]
MGRTDAQTAESSPRTGMRYQWRCPCGEPISGYRSLTFQTVRCRQCQRIHPVFPVNPLAAPTTPPPPAAPAQRPRPAKPLTHKRMAYLGLAGFLLAVSIGLLVMPLVWKSGAPRSAQANSDTNSPRSIADVWKSAEAALSEGNFEESVELFRMIEQESKRTTPDLDANQRRQLERRLAQVLLLADLTWLSLPEILRPLPEMSDRHWQLHFTKYHSGKALLIDSDLFRDGAGQIQVDLDLRTAAGPIRVMWEQVRLLQELPLEKPQRWLFGVRLDRAVMDRNRTWTIHLQPESGVLVTDSDLLRFLPLPPDAELKHVQDRMRDIPVNRVR